MFYNRALDRMTGHDYPGIYSHGFVQWELDELELGARVAIALDDPEQGWWELCGTPILIGKECDEAKSSRDFNDDSLGTITP